MIVSYDRVFVMDNGNIAEFDAPDVLQGQNGIFRAMCEHASIMLEDIHRARNEDAVRLVSDEPEILNLFLTTVELAHVFHDVGVSEVREDDLQTELF